MLGMEKVRKHAAIVFAAHAVTIIESARVLCEGVPARLHQCTWLITRIQTHFCISVAEKRVAKALEHVPKLLITGFKLLLHFLLAWRNMSPK